MNGGKERVEIKIAVCSFSPLEYQQEEGNEHAIEDRYGRNINRYWDDY